jgi:predicted DsbA family dithiol-disulfide isomerase
MLLPSSWACLPRQAFATAPKSSAEAFRAYAQEIGLDVNAFDKCFSSGKHQAAVEKDIEEGTRVGVTGMLVFFVNGRL